MYKFSYFTEPDEEKVFEFLQKNSFAIIIGMHHNFPVATHVPLAIERNHSKIILTGHIMKETDHYRAFSENENVLVIFTGANCYVSASWYVAKNVASTWNYMEVHAKGKIRLTGNDETKKIIENITGQYELPGSEAAFDQLPVEYVARLSKAIAGFHIEVESLENIFKLSQNHDEVTRKQIIENLKRLNDYNSGEIAKEMEERVK